MQLQENIPLAPLTTLQVGGPARFFVEAMDVREIREALDFAKKRGLPVFLLGGGSNLVVADEGWPGLVLKVGILGINHRHGRHTTAYFDVGAGEDWDGFVAAGVGHHCSGIECLSGIPGSVGGTPVQNVGAYGQDVSQTIQSVTALDRKTGEEVEIEREDCGFGYRTSIFNTAQRGRYIILRVAYALTHSGAPHLEYADLKRYFAGREGAPSLSEVRDAVLTIRASKGMLIRPGEEEARSAGSFFKNPILSEEEFAELRRRAATRGLEIPSYPGLEAKRKVSAAWLVEQSGFAKGYVRGHVGISRRHALAIVNLGGATAAEVIALKDDIQSGVAEQWGVRLEPEPVMVGF
ncbi:MAG TPA: UDP-N-acetylmuramate dehydrogenase [Terriglobales bacterium]|nr:UDP-N-acetylmuramate dehydrogenase [Terriglobales bacterium]